MPHDPVNKTDLIRDYLDGLLPSERMAEAEQIFENDPQARTILDPSDQIETFITRVKEAVAMPPFPAEQDDQARARIRQAVSEKLPQPSLTDDTAAVVQPDGSSLDNSEIPVARPASLTFLAPAQSAEEIGRLNGYRVLRQLGEGGMGLVFEAEDVKLGRRVALKVMKPEIAAKEQHRARFLREARTAAQVEHDHICPIYQVGEENGVPFIAMPFLKGEPLDVRMKRQKSLPLPEAIRIGREVAEGLAAAHEAGLVHRDIKPGNIWLEEDKSSGSRKNSGATRIAGRVKILDFGLARLSSDNAHLTQSGAIMGTPAYMAPEQARGKPVDHRADLFSLGVMLYEMTTGQRPFSGQDTMSILTSLAIDEPTAPNLLNPAISADLSALIMQLLSKSPEKRPEDGREVSDALMAILMQTSQPLVEAMPRMTAVPRASAVDVTSVDPWEAIDESDPTTAPTANLAAPAATRKSGSRAWVAIYLGVLLVGAAGFAAYKLFLETKDGTLIVEVDGDADVRFKNGELHVYDAEGKLKYTLTATERSKKMPPGNYTVAVTAADGVKLETDKFEMKKDGKIVLRVTAEPVVVARKGAKELTKVDLANDPDRKAADYVLSVGGTVKVDGDEREIKAAGDLPKGVVKLVRVNLWQRPATDAGLAVFKDCKNLKYLDLSHTQVTNEGLAVFKDCKNLTFLNLAATRVTDAGLAHFKDCKNLTSLSFYFTGVSDVGLAAFKDRKNLTFLNLFGTQVTDAGLAYFKDCKSLAALHLGQTKVGAEGLACFKDCKNLERVDLRGTQVTDDMLAHLAGLDKLIELNLTNSKVTAKGVEALAKGLPACTIIWDGGTIKPRLEVPASDPNRKAAEYVLSIGGTVRIEGNDQDIKAAADLKRGSIRLLSVDIRQNQKVTDGGLAVLKNAKYLTTFALVDTPVTDAGLAHLADCKDLKRIDLVRTPITDKGLAYFKDCKNLTLIHLDAVNVTDAGLAYFKDCKDLTVLTLLNLKVGDDGLEVFKDHKNLTELTLNNLPVSDAGIAHFRGCKNLLRLEMFDTPVTDAGLAHFKDCKNLNWLALGRTRVSDAGLAHFKDCKSLWYLSLEGTKVTDAGLVNVKDLKELGIIVLSETAVTDAGLAHLSGLGKLIELFLAKTKVTAKGVEGLAKSLPNCKIGWDGGTIEPKKPSP